MSYYIEPESNRHQLLKMAAEKAKNKKDQYDDIVNQRDFAVKMRMVTTNTGPKWSLARTMGDYDLVEYLGTGCRILDKGYDALEVLNSGYVYSAKDNGLDMKRTKKWKKKQAEEQKSSIPGPYNIYYSNYIFHDVLKTIFRKGVKATEKIYRYECNNLSKHIGRMKDNELIANDKITEKGEIVLKYLNLGFDVKTRNVKIQKASDVMSDIIDNGIDKIISNLRNPDNYEFDSSFNLIQRLKRINYIINQVNTDRDWKKLQDKKTDIISIIQYLSTKKDSYCWSTYSDSQAKEFYEVCIKILNALGVNTIEFEDQFQKYNTLYQMLYPKYELANVNKNE